MTFQSMKGGLNEKMTKPIEKFQYGAVSCAVWKNEHKVNGKLIVSISVTIDRAYKDKEGEWKHTDFLGVNDIPKAILALNEAYQYMVSGDKDHEDAPVSNEPKVEQTFQA